MWKNIYKYLPVYVYVFQSFMLVPKRYNDREVKPCLSATRAHRRLRQNKQPLIRNASGIMLRYVITPTLASEISACFILIANIFKY